MLILNLILTIACSYLVHASTYCGQTEDMSQNFCVYGKPDPSDPENVLITVHSTADRQGWAAVGVGADMFSSSIIVGWFNSSGGIVISDRLSSGHKLPSYSESQLTNLVTPLAVAAPSWATLSFAVSRPYSYPDGVITSKSSFIYAYSDRPVLGNINDPRSGFKRHDDVATITSLDMTK